MIIKDWKNFFISMIYFLKLIFSRQEYDVVFVSSVVFNRGPEGKNLLFSPMIDCCKKNNLKYIIIEDTDLKGIYRNFNRSKEAVPFDFVSLIQILLRKLHNLFFKKPTEINEIYLREKRISKILRRIFFNRFYSKVYITLIWNNATLWRSINNEACIIDYQHGVIFNGHEGYLKDGSPPKVKLLNKIDTMVYGDTFKKILMANDKSNFYNEDNLIKVGFNKTSGPIKELPSFNKKILFTLQITPDSTSKAVNENYIKIIENLISVNADFLKTNDFKLIFRQHPRFSADHCPSIDLEYDFISYDNLTPMSDLIDDVSMHITFNSTSVFEASIIGLPTIFIDMHDQEFPRQTYSNKVFANDVFLNDYKYPFKDLFVKTYKDLENILIKLNDITIYDDCCKRVYEWSKDLYSDFDKVAFEDFLLPKINIKNKDTRSKVYRK